MYSRVVVAIGISLCLLPALLLSQSRISDETQECLDCHLSATPGIVKDWETSRHFRTFPAEALAKAALERRVSSEDIPRNLANHVVGCYECHSQNPAVHRDNFEHFGYDINVVVSPNDCRACHVKEVEQYSSSKKALALDILRENPVYSLLVNNITRMKNVDNGTITHGKLSEHTRGQTCYACHGTQVEVDSMLTVETDFDDIEVPNLTNWPNQGVGRINPDGSFGACTACHPRHSFSIEIARKPYTCGQCHLEPF